MNNFKFAIISTAASIPIAVASIIVSYLLFVLHSQILFPSYGKDAAVAGAILSFAVGNLIAALVSSLFVRWLLLKNSRRSPLSRWALSPVIILVVIPTGLLGIVLFIGIVPHIFDPVRLLFFLLLGLIVSVLIKRIHSHIISK